MFARRPVVARRRPLLRAAVVGGGAYMAGRAAADRQAAEAQREADQEARISDLEQSQYVPQPRPGNAPSTGAGPSMLDQLSELAALHERGALTDDEFAAAKARLLA